MPIFGAMLVSLLSGLVAWLTTWVTRKVAFGIAATVMYGTITVALFVAFRAALFALETYVTGVPAAVLDGIRLAVPPAAPFCLSTYMTIWTACTVYTWQRDLLQLVAKV